MLTYPRRDVPFMQIDPETALHTLDLFGTAVFAVSSAVKPRSSCGTRSARRPRWQEASCISSCYPAHQYLILQ